MTQNLQHLTLDGATYELSSLSQAAIETLASVQFVEQRLEQLQGEMAVSQTAHVTYARALKAELEQHTTVEST